MTEAVGGARPLAAFPGLGVAAVGLVLAWGIHLLVPAVPALTACVVLGIAYGAVRWPTRWTTLAKPGLALSSRRLLRIGIVLLGLTVSLTDIAALGWLMVMLIVAIVTLSFFLTWAIGRAFRLPGHQPLLIAAGFSICGVSAIGAMGGVTGSDDEETATPIALVTLCGTLAIAALPLASGLIGLTADQFGFWAGASVHDVGQVVATAQIAGASALAIAVVVKLTRVALLAPVIAIAGLALGRRSAGRRPPVVPLFLAGFLAAVVARTLLPLPDALLGAAGVIQFILLGLALVALGAAIRVPALVRTGGRPLAVAGLSWAAIAGLSLAAVGITTAIT